MQSIIVVLMLLSQPREYVRLEMVYDTAKAWQVEAKRINDTFPNVVFAFCKPVS